MGLVKNTRRQVPVMMVVDMNWAKRDALSVNYSLIDFEPQFDHLMTNMTEE